MFKLQNEKDEQNKWNFYSAHKHTCASLNKFCIWFLLVPLANKLLSSNFASSKMKSCKIICTSHTEISTVINTHKSHITHHTCNDRPKKQTNNGKKIPKRWIQMGFDESESESQSHTQADFDALLSAPLQWKWLQFRSAKSNNLFGQINYHLQNRELLNTDATATGHCQNGKLHW